MFNLHVNSVNQFLVLCVAFLIVVFTIMATNILALRTLTLFVIVFLVFETKVALLAVWVVLDYGWIYLLGSLIYYHLVMVILRWVCRQLCPICSMDFTLSTHDNVWLELLSKSVVE